MGDQSFSRLLRRSFSGAADATNALARRTRIDARTVGYPLAGDESKAQWMGMSPAGDNGDLWRIVEVEEEANRYLIQVNEAERLVEFKYKTDEQPMPFEQAMERLAVWEQARLMKGYRPVDGQKAQDLGRHHFRDLAMRRGFVVSTTGNAVQAPGVFPAESGKFLKSDLDAMRKYRGALEGGDVLGELLHAHDPLYVNRTSIEEDIVSFGEIDLFDKMRFFANLLVEYSKVKLQYVEEFYGNPIKANREDLIARLNAHAFFNESMFSRYNALREESALYIFRFFEVDQADWDELLDFNDRRLKVELLKNPGAKATHDMLGKQVTGPLDSGGVEAMLTVSARALLYFREMLKDSAQKDVLEQAGVYRQADVSDLLNFLDLLDIKYKYMELAKVATVLQGTQDHRKLVGQTQAFRQRVTDLKANLADAGDFSPAREAQIDDFIKASAPVYLLERIATLPERIGAAGRFIADRILPKNHQLSLDLDYSQSARIAAPTRRSREEMRPAAPKPQ